MILMNRDWKILFPYDQNGYTRGGYVEEEVIAEPTSRCSEKTVPVLVNHQSEGLCIISGDGVFLLGIFEMTIREFQLVDTVIDEIECDYADERKRDAKGPLSTQFAIWGVSAAVEDEETKNEDHLVGHLSPSLHREGEKDIPSPM